ncbi:hypothetical protein B0H16DRAFT_1883004 [Mycena metata]|uniref:Uncharacterized protein n=1 Tax=Mycena metata TaxID=1033252 RepID=A0AAD7JJK6_9AGAR|nr:hypothetical protein B0H16DRAFT_1883004 [Mycena metata]
MGSRPDKIFIQLPNSLLSPKITMTRLLPIVLAALVTNVFTIAVQGPSKRQTTCVPEYGASQTCDADGCVQLVCCAGLISVADLCRDPCDVDPGSCPSTKRDTCVPEYGASQSCDTDGCVQLTCCAGLISVAGLCRDPCDVEHGSCPSTKRDTCVPEYGASQTCDANGCVQLVCCAGLISVAGLCRDPCDVAPGSCPSTKRQTTCVPEYGASQTCNADGCTQLVCCSGLISVAGLCRDPCDVDPGSC